MCKQSAGVALSGTGAWDFRLSHRLEPVTTLTQRRMYGVRTGGLGSPFGVHRLQRGCRLRRIVAEEIARFLPFLQRETAEIATFRDCLLYTSALPTIYSV